MAPFWGGLGTCDFPENDGQSVAGPRKRAVLYRRHTDKQQRRSKPFQVARRSLQSVGTAWFPSEAGKVRIPVTSCTILGSPNQ